MARLSSGPASLYASHAEESGAIEAKVNVAASTGVLSLRRMNIARGHAGGGSGFIMDRLCATTPPPASNGTPKGQGRDGGGEPLAGAGAPLGARLRILDLRHLASPLGCLPLKHRHNHGSAPGPDVFTALKTLLLDHSDLELLAEPPEAFKGLVSLNKLSATYNRFGDESAPARLARSKSEGGHHAIGDMPAGLHELLLAGNGLRDGFMNKMKRPPSSSTDPSTHSSTNSSTDYSMDLDPGCSILEACTRLEIINLDVNRLTEVPRELTSPWPGRAGLCELSFMGNAITFIPSLIGELTGLKRIALDYNQITKDGLPPSLFEDTALERITLTGNPIAQSEFMRLPGPYHKFYSNE